MADNGNKVKRDRYLSSPSGASRFFRDLRIYKSVEARLANDQPIESLGEEYSVDPKTIRVVHKKIRKIKEAGEMEYYISEAQKQLGIFPEPKIERKPCKVRTSSGVRFTRM